MIGQTISHYRITAKLGEGGMGVVYKAEDTKLGRTVALKFLPAELTRDPEAKARFVQEARAASALDHNNVCTIFEIGETDDGQMFIAMACYDGETLKEKITRGPLPQNEALDIARQIAEGLAKAHAQGIVHRDIKPANIFITKDGLVKIVDFGVAKLKGQAQMTRVGTTLGTAAYMSPEQARGEEVDRRTDIWSLGVVLYEMIAGRPPFAGEHEQAVVYSTLNEEPEPLTGLRTGVPMELERIVQKALAKRADERYQHGDDLAADLRSLQRGHDSGTTPSIPTTNAVGTAAGWGWVALSAAVVIVTVILGIRLFTGGDEVLDSVAVLPFASSSQETTDDYLADGIMGELISNLSKIGELKVTARASAMRYKGTDKTLKEIAEELGVQTVIVGEVRLAGEKVTVYAELIHAATERSLWSENFEKNLSDIESLFNDIALNVVKSAGIDLTPEEETLLTTSREVDPGAYEKFLEARYHWGKWTEEDFRKALTLLQEAVDLDPLFARAHAVLGEVHLDMGWMGFETPYEAAAKGMAAAMKALELDDTQAEAHAAIGWFKFQFEWDYRGAESYLRRAVELKPNDADMIYNLGAYLRFAGRTDEAMDLANRVIELYPQNPMLILLLAGLYYEVGMYDDSIAQAKRAIDLAPEYFYTRRLLAFNYLEKGMHTEAMAACDSALALAGDSCPARLLARCAYVYARSGRQDRALEILEDLLRWSEEDYESPVFLALIYLGLDDREKMFEWLERGYEMRDPQMIILHQYFRSLGDDPRYQDLLRRVGIPTGQGNN